MHDPRLAASLRALRLRGRLRQRDVPERAGVSQALVARLEAGDIGRTAVDTVRDVTAAIGGTLELRIAWHGGDLDRLLDARHAALVDAVVGRLRQRGWECLVEAGFSVYGERGSIDVLGMLPRARAILVVEVKSELTSLEGTLRPLDVKRRRAPGVVSERADWRPSLLGCVLVLLDTSTARRRVARFEATLGGAFPDRGEAVDPWLRHPVGPLSAIWFLSPITGGDATHRPVTVRRVRSGAGRLGERGRPRR